MPREPDTNDIKDDNILEDEPDNTFVAGQDDDGHDVVQEREPSLVVLVFYGVDDGDLEDVVEGMYDEGEKRGLFPVFAGMGGSLTMKDVGHDTPFFEALTGKKTTD